MLGLLEGLDEDGLRRTVLPSGGKCRGLLQHLALDDERFWFQAVVAGDQTVINQVMNAPEDSWEVGTDVPVEQVFDLYRQHMDRSNAIIETTPMDAEPAWWPGFFPDFQARESRRGHAARAHGDHACTRGASMRARELVDGKTWLLLD